MSLSKSMADIGRPIAYYPRLAQFFGSVNSAIFFAQLFYWQQRSENELGVYKTAQEWTEETGLTYREQVTARKILVDRSFLIETHRRLEHRIYFRLVQSAVDTAFAAWVDAKFPDGENAIREKGGRVPSNDDNAIRGIAELQSVNTAEMTAETTAETTATPMVAGRKGEHPLFAEIWAAYPKRPGANRADSLKAFNARLKRGEDPAAILAGVRGYATYCSAKGITPEYIKQPATFMGPSQHYLSDWSVPEEGAISGAMPIPKSAGDPFDPFDESTWGRDKWGNFDPQKYSADSKRAFFEQQNAQHLAHPGNPFDGLANVVGERGLA